VESESKPPISRIIDITDKSLAAGITGYAIIGGVPPASWRRKHGYLKNTK
jgi:hypothetical protein